MFQLVKKDFERYHF